MILSETHERAVIRASDREIFYMPLECEMVRQGLNVQYSRKALSKLLGWFENAERENSRP